ncbi:MAG: hypothetical protein ACOCQG_00030 [Candidatus Nanoarchaeia archaeon]
MGSSLDEFVFASAIFLVFFLLFIPFTQANGKTAGITNFTILHTNDEHSALIPHNPAIDFIPDED